MLSRVDWGALGLSRGRALLASLVIVAVLGAEAISIIGDTEYWTFSEMTMFSYATEHG